MSTKLATVVADFTTQLTTKLDIAGTTATLASATDDDGVALPSGIYFFTIDGDNSQKEHIVCSLSGTSLTAIYSVSRQGIETSGAARLHRVGASVTITDYAHIKVINDLVSGTTALNGLTPLGYDSAPSALAGNQLATVTYVLGVVNGGTVTFDQQVVTSQIAGETLVVNDLVYFKESDQRWWKVDADLITTFDQLQLGFTKTAGTAGTSITIAISGPVSGFSSLTPGSKYYASNTAGAITTTPGTYSVFVGWALTSGIILFDPLSKTIPTQNEKDAMGTVNVAPSSTNKFITQNELTKVDTFTGGGIFTVTIASPAVFSLTAHNYSNGTPVVFKTTGTLPTGLTAGTTYYVISTGLTANAFEVSTTLGGSAVNTSGTQSGVHTAGFVWIPRTGAKAIQVIAVGAGGGGAGGTNAAGGGGGAAVVATFDVSELNSSEVVYPGIAGTGGVGITNGVNGTASLFGTRLSAGGGGGGIVGGAGGGGGAFTSASGATAGSPAATTNGVSVQGATWSSGGPGNAEYGGASGGSTNYGQPGGSSIWGGGGGGGGAYTAGVGGTAGGSSGSYTAGGGGTAGVIGGAGGAGQANTVLKKGYGGAGGGGGGSGNSAGGAGGFPGGGGGGGGDVTGTGGAGAGGQIKVITYF